MICLGTLRPAARHAANDAEKLIAMTGRARVNEAAGVAAAATAATTAWPTRSCCVRVRRCVRAAASLHAPHGTALHTHTPYTVLPQRTARGLVRTRHTQLHLVATAQLHAKHF